MSPEGQEQAASCAPVVLFLCSDIMTGRGVEQILPHPCKPHPYESRECSASTTWTWPSARAGRSKGLSISPTSVAMARANGVPARQSSGDGGCAVVAPGRQCDQSTPVT